jgi:hypothetical protein
VAWRTWGLGGRATAVVAVALAALFVLVAKQAGAAEPPPPPTVSVSDVTVAEGDDAGKTAATVTIKLSAPANVDTVVNYATANGTATAPADYTATSDAVTISSGKDSATVDVAIVSNLKPQDDRAFTFTISLPDPGSDPPAATLGQATATITIVDDDWRFAIAPNPANATAAENGGKIDYAVTLKGADGSDAAAPPKHKLSLDYKVNNGSALLGTNFKLTDGINPSGTFTFAAGDSAKHINVTGLDDHTYAASKNFNVTLANPTGGKLADGADQPHAGTITNTNPPPVLGISDCAGVVKAGTDASFTIRTSGATQLPATVHYTTVDDTTTEDDYAHVDGDLTFQPGQTEQIVLVHTKVNPPDGDRTFHMQLSNPRDVKFVTDSASHAACTIRNSSTGSGSSLGSVAITGPDPVVEPAPGASAVSVSFTVTYTPPAQQPSQPKPVTVNWSTKDGTAKAPGDYVAASGTLTWNPGTVGPKTFTVKVNPAGSPPNTTAEVFSATITATNATVSGSGSADATILPANTTTSILSAADTADVEGAGTIPVKISLSPAATAPVTVHYTTEDGTALAGRDFNTAAGDLTFAPGEVSKMVSITIINNSTPERDKMLTLRLSAATGATIGRAAATITILNDDALPTGTPRANPLASPLPAPVPLPAPQPKQPGGGAADHLVLPAILNGESKVDAKGRAAFKVTCPKIVVKRCTGTITLEVRVAQKVKKGSKAKPTLKTIRVGSGTFTITVGKTNAVPVKLTKAGLDVVKALHRLKVKATVKATDASGTKGVTAWIVSLVEAKKSKAISVSVK